MRRIVKGHKECESKNFYNFNGDFIVEKVIRFQKNGFFEKSSSEYSQESCFLAESFGFAGGLPNRMLNASGKKSFRSRLKDISRNGNRNSHRNNLRFNRRNEAASIRFDLISVMKFGCSNGHKRIGSGS